MLINQGMHKDLKCALHGNNAVNMRTLKTQGLIGMYISRMMHVRGSQKVMPYIFYFMLYTVYTFHNICGITKGIVIYSVVSIFVNSLLLLLNNSIYVQPVKVTLVCLQQLVYSLLQCLIIQLLMFLQALFQRTKQVKT